MKSFIEFTEVHILFWFRSLMTQIKTRKRREKNGQIVLEGYRLIKDALEAGVVLTTILFNNPSDIESLKLSENVKLLKVPYKTIQLWSNLTSPSGLIGIDILL